MKLRESSESEEEKVELQLWNVALWAIVGGKVWRYRRRR